MSMTLLKNQCSRAQLYPWGQTVPSEIMLTIYQATIYVLIKIWRDNTVEIRHKESTEILIQHFYVFRMHQPIYLC